MASVPRSDSRRLYSWWWDSHNTPKNSKWLQENLTEIDEKVKAMIKLIEEDADSFARRAEMYYKKRPELMKLVEEFYRAYRALAERYNHATGELRHAHRTLAKAFPDQVPPDMSQDSPSKPLDLEPHTPEVKSFLFDTCNSHVDETGLFESLSLLSEDSEGRMTRRALKYDLFEEKEMNLSLLSNENQNLKEKVLVESERAEKAESEVEGLKQALADMQIELENLLLQYQMCLSKVSLVEAEFLNVQKDSVCLSERASRAEIEVQTLREALFQMETERNSGLVKHKECLEKITSLENKLSQAGEAEKGLVLAESETQSLKLEISRLKLEKEAALHSYKECHGKASALEDIVHFSEKEAEVLKRQAERAEAEAYELKKSLSDLNKQKEASSIQYKWCMERISELDQDLSSAKEEVNRLNNDVVIGNLKLKNAEDKYNLLKISNQSLKNEAENLVKKIAVKDQELSEKQQELESLERCFQDEHLRRAKIESTLETLRKLHSQSQEDQKALAMELKNMLQMLTTMELNKQGLEEAVQLARNENEILCQANLSAAASMEKLQGEIFSLTEIKARLEDEVRRHTSKGESLQEEVSCLEEEIRELKKNYHALVEQVEAAGLDPNSLASEVKSLRDENSFLSRNCEQINDEKEIMMKKMKTMQESCKSSQAENTELVSEKASLLSQLQVVTESMHRLLEKNAISENSLSAARLELEVLREKSKGLEEICELLKKERSYLLSERDSLSLKLKTVERKVESLEKRCMGLQEKYSCIEKEKEAMNVQVEKLELCLSVEKQERTSSQKQSEARISGLKKQIRHLEEENMLQRQEHQDELEKSLKSQLEFSALRKFIKEVEEKNHSLISECQKHVDASLLAEKLITELESESLEQQVEAELLLDEIERLRLDIYEIFKALDGAPELTSEDQIDNDKTLVTHILRIIDNMKTSLSKHEDDKQLSLVENSVLLALIEQLESKGMDIELQKRHMEKELRRMDYMVSVVELEKEKLLELNKKLRSELRESHWQASILEAETDSLRIKHDDLVEGHKELEERNLQLNQNNRDLMRKLSSLENEKHRNEKYLDEAFMEHLSSINESSVFRCFTAEKTREMRLILQALEKEKNTNFGLKTKLDVLSEEVNSQKGESLHLCDTVRKLEDEMQRMREHVVQMKRNVTVREEQKLLGVEMKLEAAEKMNSKLCQTINELKLDLQESLHLQAANEELESELSRLREEINEKTSREQSLILELQEKNSKLQIFEVETTAFYFEFQMSAIRDILYRNKLQELAGACTDLSKENSSKASEIELMKSSLRLLENKIIELKSQLPACSPFTQLESKLRAYDHQEPEILEGGTSISEMLEEEPLLGTNTRTKSVGKMVEEVSKGRKSQHLSNEFELLKHRRFLGRGNSRKKEDVDSPKLQRIRTQREGMRMKDIPLDHASEGGKRGHFRADDQMLELWETAEDPRKELTIGDSLRMSFRMPNEDYKTNHQPPATDSDLEKELSLDRLLSNREMNSRRVLERLSSDSKKLESLQTTVDHLRSKLVTCKKSRTVDFDTVHEQLQEADETITKLVDLNTHLMKSTERWDDTHRRRVAEETRKGSERIGRLQLELQKIQYILLKMEEEKKSMARSKFFRGRSIVLRDFIIHGGRKNGGKRKKGLVCGCFRPSTSRSGRLA